MPSQRQQINVRASDDTVTRFLSLVERMRAATGIELSQADVIRAAILALEKEYPPEAQGRRARPRKGGAS